MERKVTILSIKKNEITIKIKKKHPHIMYSCLIIFAFLLCFTFGSRELKNIGASMSQIYNPVSSLYNDNSDVVFTNSSITELNFVVPLMGANYEIASDGTIEFEVKNSIMVKACESGVIDDIGITNNGVKYIKIKHTEEIFSLIENVDIVGVQKNDIVKRGQDISTAKENSKVYFQLFNGDTKITNIKIHLSKLIWEA